MSLDSKTLMSAAIGGGLGALGYMYVGESVAAPLGGGEYLAIFIGTGVAATIAPYVTQMVMSGSMPQMTSDYKAMGMNVLYGGATGLIAYYIFDMITGDAFSTTMDVFLSTALASVIAPYLTMKSTAP